MELVTRRICKFVNGCGTSIDTATGREAGRKKGWL